MKNTKVLLFFILLTAFILRVLFMYAAPIKIWDETVYINLGRDLSHNLSDYSFTNGWSDYIPTSQGESYGYPNAGFRAPFLPYLIAFLNIAQLGFLVNFIMPVIGTISVFLVYLLGKELFNKKVGLIAALLFTFIPLHLIHSGKVLTDALVTFFILLSFLSYWKGFEKGNNSFKILFGVFLAFALLSRYTALWVLPVFTIYIIFQGKLLQILRDKFLWATIGIFILILTPWFIYGLFTYSNPFGPFIHGSIASSYWGGAQPWHHFFDYWWVMFSIVGFAFIASLAHIIFSKAIFKKEIILLITWFVVFLGIAMFTLHKEDRFLLPVTPAIVLLTAYSIEKFKKYVGKIILITLIPLLISAGTIIYDMYRANYTVSAKCYQQVGAKLKELKGDFLVVSENSSLSRYYAEHENVYYPGKISEESIRGLEESTKKKVLFVMTEYNSGFEWKNRAELLTLLNKNYDLIYECPQSKEINRIYLKVDTSTLQNLVPNNSFEDEGSDYWVTNTPDTVKTDTNNKGIAPSSQKTAMMTGSKEEADLHTANIPVAMGAVYQFKVYIDATQQKSGEFGFLIDEYSESNEWLGAKWVGNATPKTKSYMSGLYTPTSANVYAIRIHAYFNKDSKGSIYLDNYQLYKIN